MALHHDNVSRMFDRFAHCRKRSACEAHLSRSSQTGSSFSVLAAMMTKPVA